MIQDVRLAKNGDKEAFSRIIKNTTDSLYKVAHGFFSDYNEIADVISNTILKAYENIKSLKDEKYFKTWIIKILINECNYIIRKNKKIVYLEDISQDIPSLENNETIDIEQCLNMLNQDLKNIVTLYYYEEFQVNEISQILGIPEGTVKSRLSRARKYLYNILKIREDCI